MGDVSRKHIHLLVSVPPHLSASKFIQYIKANSSRKLLMKYKQFFEQRLWARGYFIASNANITD